MIAPTMKRPRADAADELGDDHADVSEALRGAKAPYVVAPAGRARQLASSAVIHALPAHVDTLLVARSQTKVLTLPDEQSVEAALAEAACEAEARMTDALEAIGARLEACSAVYELSAIAEEEAVACGLSARHGVRLALETVLGHDASTPKAAKALAAAVHDAAAGARPVATVLALLDSHGAAAAALNVMSVLCFGEAVPREALAEWQQLQEEEEEEEPSNGRAATRRLQPLLEWIKLPRSSEEKAVVADGDGANGADGRRTGADAASESESDDANGESAASAGAALWHRVAVNDACADWSAASAVPALTAELGPTHDGVVVLDGLVCERLRAELLSYLVGVDGDGGGGGDGGAAAWAPPAKRWERTTVDGAGLGGRTWGLQPRLLRRLERRPPPCVLEVQSRLAALYPEYTIARMDASALAPFAARRDAEGGGAEGGGGSGEDGVEYCCPAFVANAAVYGNSFDWHVDADPSSLPPSKWLAAYGDYANGAGGKPLLVSLLVYVDAHWQADWAAETLFLSEARGVGVLVQPRPARAILMHQDVCHRVSTPSISARRPRYSLVWKLLFVPRAGMGSPVPEAAKGNAHFAPPRERETICRPEWGPPTQLG